MKTTNQINGFSIIGLSTFGLLAILNSCIEGLAHWVMLPLTIAFACFIYLGSKMLKYDTKKEKESVLHTHDD